MAPPNHHSDACITHKTLHFCWNVDVQGSRSRRPDSTVKCELTHLGVDWFSTASQSELELEDLKAHYNPYTAAGSAEPIGLFNPTSVLSALSKFSIENFWGATGLPVTIVLFT